MTPRIPADDLGRDHHGGINGRALEPPELQVATDAFTQAAKDVRAIDPVTLEVTRLRNAVRQQCLH